MFPVAMFGTRTQRKVLRVLAEKNKRYTISELAEMCHRSEATVSRALSKSYRYSFIERHRVSGSKQLAYGLNPDSRYTAAIRDFFSVEREVERFNGTVPVDVWNLLEDISRELEELDAFVELFLFGSYATGEYYAGSDIDLLLVHTPVEGRSEIEDLVDEVGVERTHILTLAVEKRKVDRLSDEELVAEIKTKSPVDQVDVLLPLTGEVAGR